MIPKMKENSVFESFTKTGEDSIGGPDANLNKLFPPPPLPDPGSVRQGSVGRLIIPRYTKYIGGI